MRKIPPSALRIAGIVLLSLPILGMAFAFIVTLAAIINPPPNDYAGLSKAAGVFMWAMGGWLTFLCALVGARLSFQEPASTRLALFFVTPPLCIGLGVLLWDTSMYVLALLLVGAYFVLSLACLIVCPIAISSALKHSKANPAPTTEADPASAK